jgi:hypothetical protein
VRQCLSDEHVEVQVAVSAALCNLLLDFAPMKRLVVERGSVRRLVEFAGSPVPTLRLNGAACWNPRDSDGRLTACGGQGCGR